MISLSEFSYDIEIPTGGMGISRVDMPQIKADKIPDFLKYLKSLKVKYKKTSYPVGKLKPTQKEFNNDKIIGMMQNIKKIMKSKPVLISNDLHILDGHHRYAAMYNIDKEMKFDVIQVDLPINKLLIVSNDFKGTSYKNINENYIFIDFRGYLKNKCNI